MGRGEPVSRDDRTMLTRYPRDARISRRARTIARAVRGMSQAGQAVREMARSGRFELPTPRFVVWCSIQLSYERFGGAADAGPRTDRAPGNGARRRMQEE